MIAFKKIWRVLLYNIIFLSFTVAAEPTLYSEFALTGINNLNTTGFIYVDVKQGEQEKIQLYLRKNSINSINTAIEEIDGIKTLHVREIEQHTDKNWDKTAIAHIVITLKKLNELQVHDTKYVSINGFKTDFLKISTSGRSRVDVNDIQSGQLSILSRHQSQIKATKITANAFQLYLRGGSKVAVEHLSGNTVQVDLRGNSRLSANNIVTTSFEAFGTYRTYFELKEHSEIDSLSLTTNRSAEMNVRKAQINIANCGLKDDSKINLGEVNMLTINARDNSHATYQGKPALNLKKQDKAKVELTTIPLEGALHE